MLQPRHLEDIAVLSVQYSAEAKNKSHRNHILPTPFTVKVCRLGLLHDVSCLVVVISRMTRPRSYTLSCMSCSSCTHEEKTHHRGLSHLTEVDSLTSG
ncbi:hypothetical protein KC19_VG197000 [Ceratodon purpureus]|uniref:Uncharacterized protein n=1 Tax=Ceratodon purpureus TaxID=3225 RepID=A0A8T0HRN7_CERPU|nr:hypothetical protein KC19_VG197000 [Ceratodon purpureus]